MRGCIMGVLMKRIANNILRLVFPVIFVSYLGVLSCYTHMHIVNGARIVHSHPFRKPLAGQPFHHHTQADFQLIQSVTSFCSTGDAVPHFEWEVYAAGEFILSAKPVGIHYYSAPGGILSLRAPPVYL